LTVCEATHPHHSFSTASQNQDVRRRSKVSKTKGYARCSEDLQIYDPMLALESTAMITPCLKMNPKVVVPWLGFTYAITSCSNLSTCRTHAQSSCRANTLHGSRAHMISRRVLQHNAQVMRITQRRCNNLHPGLEARGRSARKILWHQNPRREGESSHYAALRTGRRSQAYP
jgi:hypothetical protein